MLAQHFRHFPPPLPPRPAQAYLEISKLLPSKMPLTDFVFTCFGPVCVLILSPLKGYVRLTCRRGRGAQRGRYQVEQFLQVCPP